MAVASTERVVARPRRVVAGVESATASDEVASTVTYIESERVAPSSSVTLRETVYRPTASGRNRVCRQVRQSGATASPSGSWMVHETAEIAPSGSREPLASRYTVVPCVTVWSRPASANGAALSDAATPPVAAVTASTATTANPRGRIA
nr:hypothetical protein [Halomicroarcula marina]